MSRRSCLLQARQVAIFPVLLVVETDDETGRTTLQPLPLDRQGRLVLTWLTLLLLGWLADLSRQVWSAIGSVGQWISQSRWGVRASLELRMALILGRQFGLAAMGR